MQCTRPVWLHQSDMFVPCGKCVSCRMSKSREWAVRIMHEADSYDAKCFATFTYDDENVPADMSVSKECLQRLIKRIRRKAEPRVIRYFACGEYGEKFGRPHYHAILFGLSTLDRSLLEQSWDNGFIQVGSVSYESARYVADYMQKGKPYPGRHAPFNLMSGGLGKDFAKGNAKLLEESGLTVFGVPMGIPRYYLSLEDDGKKVVDISPEDLEELRLERLKEQEVYYREKYKESEVMFKKVMASRAQKERNARARLELYRKGKL